MSRWLPRLLRRIHAQAGQGRVRFTLKALRELAALGAGLDAQDACDILAVVYLKVVVRTECVVVSFHEDEIEIDEDP